MIIAFVNPYSCGGKGIEKWERLKTYINSDIRSLMMNRINLFDGTIKDFFIKGNTRFIAAGGDGTVNLVLNSLIRTFNPDELKEIKLGAIGLGSSNDFHKPFSESKMLGDIPAKIDFEKAEPRDIGCITFLEGGIKKRKYFLINASIGITAEANYFFNNPDLILSHLKRINTKSAIIYAAFKTIYAFKNLSASITVHGTSFETCVTNLGITKNPNFSDGFSYDSLPCYVNGKMKVYLAYNMNKINILELMYALTHYKFSLLKKTISWDIETFTIKSDNEFTIEYDGETIKSKEADFSILKQAIKVCK